MTDNKLSAPMYVRLGLWMVKSRKAALGYMWFCIACAAAFVIAGIVIAILVPVPFPILLLVFLSAPAMLFAAYWYWAAIKWTDQFGTWSRTP
ncbi:hypothetical protein [Massilia glaciei]|uniref:Uncharacterized protein n=1 Tax=Massilia glaciei TaxID=1524097 RepID=A0A2U2I6Q9_9BURK|nr:hypothetical protein [Massilia glaciei]PWF55385.1 hypothetical protein C7C56_002120 [Massilia glaciei]